MTAQLAAEKPTIKILLYSDDHRSITNGTKLLGLSSMIERLEAHAPTFANLSIKWVSRRSTNAIHADNKLNVVLEREVATGVPFDAIWFFGLHQTNTRRISPLVPGGPENELETEEIEALNQWMKINDGIGGGGVLMTGDHNSPAPPNRLPGLNEPVCVSDGTLLGLGRALGQGVPRAGELRNWIGPPSSLRADSFNTSVGLQTDLFGQTLTHEKDSNGQVHPLFFYRGADVIDKFPDHAHEGALFIPDILDPGIWPTGQHGQPRPVVIAFGQDIAHGRQISLVAAYDGDSAGVGRIVADSSWHHYLNINLNGFPHPALAPSASDQIGQFYGNLAVWLAPRHKREQMAQAMARELAEYTKLLEDAGNESELGEIADMILKRAAAPCEAHELLQALSPAHLSAESFSLNGTSALNASARKETLGAVLWSYQAEMDQVEESAARLSAINPTPVTSPRFANTVAAPANGSHYPGGTTQTASRLEERSREMGCSEGQREWTIDMTNDEIGAALAGLLVFCLNDDNNIVTGSVVEAGTGNLISAVEGTHTRIFDLDAVGFMELAFDWNGSAVTMSGATLKDLGTTRFAGRFHGSSMNGNGTSEAEEIFRLGPGSGDTGTSTGQTT